MLSSVGGKAGEQMCMSVCSGEEEVGASGRRGSGVEDYEYCKYFCEENVYRLLHRKVMQEGAMQEGAMGNEYAVVLVTNPARHVQFWGMKCGDPRRDGLVVFDYHVFLLELPTSSSSSCSSPLVWDLDSLLPIPCDFKTYRTHTLRPTCNVFIDGRLVERGEAAGGGEGVVNGEGEKNKFLQRQYRLVSARNFLDHFASDRTHMRRGGEGEGDTGGYNYISPPPPWEPIRGRHSASAMNLFTTYLSTGQEEENSSSSPSFSQVESGDTSNEEEERLLSQTTGGVLMDEKNFLRFIERRSKRHHQKDDVPVAGAFL